MRNLLAKGPVGCVAVLHALLSRVEVGAVQANPQATLDLQWLVAKDRPVLLAAVGLKCDALVTGDNARFGIACGKTFLGVQASSPTQLFELL
ncbi:hypothetical protein BH11PSE7_BH11PSE7_24770 [soil metagenome]